jgi:hypothetical protein
MDWNQKLAVKTISLFPFKSFGRCEFEVFLVAVTANGEFYRSRPPKQRYFTSRNSSMP